MDEIARGDHAQRLLHDEVLLEALNQIELDLVVRWKQTVVGDTATREACYQLHAAVEMLRAQLTSWVTTAKLKADRGSTERTSPSGGVGSQ